LLIAFTLPLLADEAKSDFNKGRDAEARQQWELAFEYYKKAHELHPKDAQYQASFERALFEASAVKIKRAQTLRDDGQIEAALAEFLKAKDMDPSSAIAQQEIVRTQRMIDDQQQKKTQMLSSPRGSSLGERVRQAQGPVDLAPISDQPITLKLTEDT